MLRVQVLSGWSWPDLRRQTPGGGGIWEDIRFLFEPVASCDYVAILNWGVRRPMPITCPPGHVWQILQEPPDEAHRFMHRGLACARRVYTQDLARRGERHVHSQPALPWHVNRSYDQLQGDAIPAKPRALSWITSNKALTKGHRARLGFLAKLRQEMDFDLYGRGFQYVEDKWDALAPYRYSIAVENYRNPYYWSEKLADCYLAWCLPIYFGCTRIQDYFPPESLVQVDIRDPLAVERIREVVASNPWQERLEAIAEARRLVLERHQLFPFLAREIRESQASAGREVAQAITLSNKMRPGDALLALPARLRHLYWPRLLKRLRRPNVTDG